MIPTIAAILEPVELVQPIIWVLIYQIRPLVINSLGGGHTHKHTDFCTKKFKKPGSLWLLGAHACFKNVEQ